MIIYNKTIQKQIKQDIHTKNVGAGKFKLTVENKSFLELLNLKVKENV